jgi:hypothetical protein
VFFSQALNPRRISRTLVTVLVLTLFETVAAPILAPKITTPESHAVTGSITAAGSTTRSFITIPAGVESITLTVTGAGGGKGGSDVNTGGKGGMAQRLVVSFAVTPGDVVALFPGNAGATGASGASTNTGGVGNGGSVAGGASTVTDSYWNINGTSYQNPSFSGGASGKVGTTGTSGSGGGGGAASVVAINRNIVAVAGGAGGGGGAGSATNGGGTDGVDANTANSNLMYGGTGKDSGAGQTCSASDGGSGGGGGGGYLGGTGGNSETVGTECSGRGGYRGNAYTYNALSSTNTSFDTSASPDSPLNGTITYSYDVKSSGACTPSTTIVDIYTVLKFDASVSCTWTAPSTVSVIDIFAVGGGGGGGEDGGTGGGGGAGLSRTAVPISPSSSLTIKTGYGGRGGLFNAWDSNYGETSSVTTSTGAVYNAPGGAGGGVRATGKGVGGSATVNGTFAGGAGGTYPSIGAIGGVGNYGISNYFFGSQNTYAGGGGGGCYYDTNSNATGAAGRNGGGAGCSNSATLGQSDAIGGTAGTGGGGGGGGAGGSGRVQAGKGGSGVILIRYATNALDAFPSSLTSALAGRYTPGDLQLLDSNRKGWIDSSGTNATVSNGSITATGLSITTQTTTDSSYATGSTKDILTVKGTPSSSVTLTNLNTGYTLYHVARYVRGGTANKIFTTSGNDWTSGFYWGEGVAYHYNWLTDDRRSLTYNWQITGDQSKVLRQNGIDVSKNDDSIGTQLASVNNFGINNYNYGSDFQVNDILIFNRELTIGEMRLLEEYLARINGLSLSQYHDTTETDTAYLGTSTYSYMFQQSDARNNLNDTFTVEAWLKPDSVCNTNVCTYFAREGQIRLVDRNGKLGFILYGDGSWEWVYDVAPLPSGEWHHVAVAKTLPGNNNNSVKVYLDGKLVYVKAGSPYRTSTTAVASPSNSSSLAQVTTWSYIGVVSGGGERWYGNVDEFKVWKVGRSQAEIAGDMYSNDRYDPNLQMYFNMNYVAGTHVNQYKVPNLAYYGHGRSDLFNWDVDTISFSDVKNVTTSGPFTTITFPRAYITQYGGWKVPSGISQVQTVVVGGGGGGGGGYQGGGGGAGGLIETLTTLVPGTIYPITVGTGGRGTINMAITSTTDSYVATSGDTTTAFGLTVLGGGRGASEFDTFNGAAYVNTTRAALSGGSGGGAVWGTGNATPGSGTSGQGNNGGNGGGGGGLFYGGGGGGAGSVGRDGSGTKGGNGGAAKLSQVTGTYLAGGGGGTVRSANATTFIGYGGDTTTASAQGGGGNGGYTDNALPGATGGPVNGTANTGGGGGAGLTVTGSNQGYGAAGGSGVVALRYITALVPSYTKPTTAYLNVGMTETFTTNVAVDSATVGLTRTFKWESTTPTANGSYTILKSGTGAANAAYSWVPSDTSTTGSGYLYRLTVTDSDTAGLFITDSSTAYAVINPALKVTAPAAGTSLAKKINVSRNETFTITLGTPTYKAALSPVIPGITIDTSTAGSVLLKIGDTATVGTWLETLTVTDSVAASVTIPLTIAIASPPTLINTNEITTNGLVLHYDAGNSASLLLPDSSTTSGATWRDLSGRKNDATTGAGINTGGYLSTGCTAPNYSSDNGGTVVIEANSDQCLYTPFTGREFDKSYTFEAWFKTTASLPAWSGIVSQGFTGGSLPISVTIGSMGGSTLYVGFYDGGTWRAADCGYTPTIGAWTHVAGTYDGITMRTYINGSNSVNGATCATAFTGGMNSNINSNGIVIGKGHSGGTGVRTFPGSIASVRLYNVPLTASQILQNYNATKDRFDSSNNNILKPSQKYGKSSLESFTVTSGSETRTVAFSVGDRSGVDWDTSTVISQIKLSVQESLTPGTYYDTMTVTDNLGQSTYLPFKFTISKADTLTVYVDTPTALSYTGNQATFTQTLNTIGAVGLESGTALSATVKFKPAGTTCATGGYCRVGDIGPGGGIVFIDTSTASSDGRIYEVAPANWSGTDDLSTVAQYCSNTNLNLGATQYGIGWGDTNTTLAKNQCLGGAVAKVNTFNQSNNTGYSDWFIPDTNEAIELIKIPTQAGLVRVGSNWTVGNYGYWTSTEVSASDQRSIGGSGSSWNVSSSVSKSESTRNMVRPVRAFKSCWAIDTCTAIATTDTPTAAGIYSIVPSALTVGAGSLSNYVAVNYISTPLTVNKVAPAPLVIPWINTNYPDTFTVNVSVRAGTGNLSFSTTSGTASGCALDYRKLYTTSQGTCTVTIARAADRNYTADTATATVFFLAFVNSQPTNQVGSGSTIGLNGATSLETSTVAPPAITSLSVLALSLSSGITTFTINGSGFTGSITVKFWRNKIISATSSNGTTIDIPVSSISAAGATSGRIAVITSAGEAVSVDSLTITP